MNRVFFLSCAVVLLAQFADLRQASACSCLPPHLPTVYENSSEVVEAYVWPYAMQSGYDVYYWAYVYKTFKGCTEAGEWVLLKTPSSSAACGVSFMGGDYLITGNSSSFAGWIDVIQVGLCGMNKPMELVTEAQLEFLNTRYTCCGDDCGCVNNDMVNCFVNPCKFASCPEGECVANYCGGCQAEFYDDKGQMVCNACDEDWDCAWTQQCVEGQCLSRRDRCEDLAQVDFGLCKMVLGWGVKDGRCQLLSGCGDQGYNLFPEADECIVNCIDPCMDHSQTDFGLCEMLLGWGVKDGKCQPLSGCSGQGYDFYPDEESCRSRCFERIPFPEWE